MKQYIRGIHAIQSEIGGGEQGVFDSRETNEAIAEVEKILNAPIVALEPIRTRYKCEEEVKEEQVIFLPAHLLIQVWRYLLIRLIRSLMMNTCKNASLPALK
jgi:hypothetical protein